MSCSYLGLPSFYPLFGGICVAVIRISERTTFEISISDGDGSQLAATLCEMSLVENEAKDAAAEIQISLFGSSPHRLGTRFINKQNRRLAGPSSPAGAPIRLWEKMSLRSHRCQTPSTISSERQNRRDGKVKLSGWETEERRFKWTVQPWFSRRTDDPKYAQDWSAWEVDTHLDGLLSENYVEAAIISHSSPSGRDDDHSS